MDHKLHARDLSAAGGAELPLFPTGARHTLIIQRNETHLIEVDASAFSTNSSSPRPATENKPAAGRQGCVQFAATALCFADAHPEKRLLISGHTDTQGESDHNVELSKHRANAILALVEGNREIFGDEADGPHIPKARKHQIMFQDRVDVMDWAADTFDWPTRLVDNNSDYFATVRSFQSSYNTRGKAGNLGAPDLAIDGDFGPDTWRAAFDCYRHEIAGLLELTLDDLFRLSTKIADPDRWITPRKITCCGESQPIDNPGRDTYRSAFNRRVEVLYFDSSEEPACPCFGGNCVPQACALYNSIYYRRIPVQGSPFFSKLVIGWPAMVVATLPQDLWIELGGSAIPTQRLTLTDARTDSGTTLFVFEQHDRSSPCSLRAGSGQRFITLWENQLINSNRGARYISTIETLEGPKDPAVIPPGPSVTPEEPLPATSRGGRTT